jgi:PAS domain S-box-containing protein
VKRVRAREHCERLLHEVQEAAQLGVWEWTLGEDEVRWTPELYRIYGVTPLEYAPTYQGYLARIHPEDRERVRAALEDAMARGASFSQDERILRPDGNVRYLHTWGHCVPGERGRLAGLIGICQDVTERVIAAEVVVAERRRFRLLSEVSQALIFTPGFDDGLEAVARLLVPELADWCSVFRLEPDGSVRPVASAHVDPASARQVLEYLSRFPAAPEDFYRAEAVIASGESAWMPEIADEDLRAVARTPEQLQAFRELRPLSRMVVPLAARGAILGAIALNYTSVSGRHYSHADLELAEEIGRRTAIVLDNARLFAEARRAA